MKEFSVKLQNYYINIKSKSKGGEISGGYPYPDITGSLSIYPMFPVVDGSFCLTFFEVDDINGYGRDYWVIKAKDDVESFLLDPKKYTNWVLWYYHDVHSNWKKKPAGIKLQWTLTTVVDVTINIYNIYNKKGNRRLSCERIG